MSDFLLTPFVAPDDFPKDTPRAVELLRRSFRLVHIKRGEKGPRYGGWQHGLTDAEIESRFRSPSNVGVVLGALSGGVVDVDLDCPEAVFIAPYLLPRTATFGRESNRGSHHLFYTDEDVSRETFQDVRDKKMLLELRGSGHQTVFPSSQHPSGEVVRFERTGKVACVPLAELKDHLKKLAALTQIARAWPKVPGVRHDLGLALAGALVRHGWDADLTETLVEVVAEAAGDEESSDRGRGAHRAAGRIEVDLPTTGWNRVAELLGGEGPAVIRRVKEWLGVKDFELIQATGIVQRLEQNGRVEAVYEASPDLARLSATDLAKARQSLKARFPALNLNDLDRAISEARGTTGPPPDPHGRHTVVLGDDRVHFDLVEEAAGAFADWNVRRGPALFSQPSGLVAVEDDGHGRPRTALVDLPALRYRVDQAMGFVQRRSRGGFASTRCPEHLASDLTFGLRERLPKLSFVTGVPLVRPDGSVVAKPGHDAATGVLYRPCGDGVGDVPEHPTEDDVAEAASLLVEDVLGDFPFEDEASRTNALAYLLTPHLRLVVPGPYPLALVDATKRGTGKGLLTDVVSVLATGREAPKTPLPAGEDEIRKTITSMLLGGPAMAVFDNVDRPIRSAALESLMTASVWNDRLLGASQQLTLSNWTVWAATGNNLLPQGDLPRRCYLIRMDAGMARPSERAGFRHPDLLAWVRANRERIVRAVLVVVRAWFSAGCPEAPVRPMGSYGPWSRTVGGILAHAGTGTPLGNADRMLDVCDEDGEWEGFLEALHGHYGDLPFPARNAVSCLSEPGNVSLRDATPPYLLVAADRGESTLTQTLGSAFRKRRGERFGPQGLRLVDDGGKTKGSQRWRVVCDSPPEHAAPRVSADPF